MLTGNTINKYLLIILLVCLMCFCVSCSGDNAIISKTTTFINDAIPDDYIRDGICDDGSYSGRVYKNDLIINLNGKQYLAVGEYTDISDLYVYYSDEDISRMQAGDLFVYDRDISFVIDSLNVIDWNYPFGDPRYPDRPNGKIILNNNYCLVHGCYERDDNENIVDDSKAKKWQLTTDEFIQCQNIGICPVDKVKLYEYSDKCVFRYAKNGSESSGGGDHILEREDLDSIFDTLIPSDRSFCACSFVIRQNKIVEVSFYVDYY